MRPTLAQLLAGLVILTVATVSTAHADDDDGGGGGFRAGKSLRIAPLLFNNLPRLSAPKYRKKRVRKPVAQRSRRVNEVVAVGLSETDVTRLVAMGFKNLGRRDIGTFGSTLTRLGMPSSKSSTAAMEDIYKSAPNAVVSENVLYGALSRKFYEAQGDSCGERCEAFELTDWTADAGRCSVGARIGVIDTAADLSHPSLVGARIESRVMRGADREPSDSLHGTAVLSLLVGASNSNVVGVANSAELLHADAFHGEGDKTRSDVFDLVAAIDWLVSSQVDVINLSLSGPDNPVLKRAIEAAQNQGIHIVAAAGKPDSKNLAGYPARYPGVTAVGAVDSRLRASRLSLRGMHLTFAAPGVGLSVAHGKNDVRRVDGTSFATPFVSAAFAMARARGVAASDVADNLARTAQDLGPKGRDSVFGWGLIRYSGLPRC